MPGRRTYGLEIHDQPVFASDTIRYQGEPVACVAADHPETARRAAEAIVVDRLEDVGPALKKAVVKETKTEQKPAEKKAE